MAIVVLSAVVAACTDDSTSTAKDASTSAPASGAGTRPDSLAGTAWSLERAAEGGAVPTLDFSADGKVSGSTGCNRFAGTFTQKGSALRITLGPLTQMACASDAATQQEQHVISALGETRRAERNGTTLTLSDAGGKDLLTYTAVSGQLAGTSWKVTGVNNGRQAVESTALTEKLTLEFGSDGAVSGNGGCNTFRGTYTQDGDQVKISGLASTKVACDQDVTDLEAQYLRALEAATVAERSGSSLTLRDASGATQVTATSAG